MAEVSLTRGAIASITEGGAAADGLKPILQVTEVRPVSTAQTTAERFRMMLSDGVSQQQAMLATQMNAIVKSGQLQKGSIVQLIEYVCNTIQGRRIIIIISLKVLDKSDVIEAPKVYDSGSTMSQNRVPMPAQSSGMVQTNAVGGNPPYGGSHSGIPVAGQSAMGGASLPPTVEPTSNNSSYDGSYARSMNTVNSLPSKAEHGAGTFTDSHLNGGNQSHRFSNQPMGGGYRPPGNAYGRSGQPSYQQPPPLYNNRGPVAKNEAPARIIPIAALNPYQGRWTIKARVTTKGDLRRYNNTRGEGKVFSFDLLDSEGGEIRVTCFNTVVDQFYDQIEVGKVYLISKGTLKPARKSFNHLNNEYEIFLESTSTIQPCSGEDDNIPRQQFNFQPINIIESMETNSTVDVIGIVSVVNPAASVMRKNGTETFKRTIQLKDMSGRSVEVTLWGNFCNNEGQQLQALCDSGSSPVLAVKTGRINEFNGKSVGTLGSSQVFIDPDIPEAHKLMDWYNREGKNLAALSISRDTSNMGRADVRKTVSQIKDEGLGRSEKPDWISVKAAISFIKVDNFCYTACPLMVGDRKCNKKVNNNGDGTWQCDRCEQSFKECDYRYILQFQIQDHTGMTWVTTFEECGEEILGLSAKELYLLKYEKEDDEKFAEIIRSVHFNQYLFKLKVKEETFSDEQRVKSTVVKAEKVNPSSESKYLLGLIEKLSGEDPNGVLGMLGTFASGSGMPSAGYVKMESKPFISSATNNFGSNTGADGYRTAPANQIGSHMNNYGGSMNYSIGRETQLFCNNCSSTGHSFQNCPKNMNRQGQSFGGGFANRVSNAAMDGAGAPNACFKCQQPGHWARDCPGVNAVPSGYGSSSISGKYAKQHVGGY